jgi:hypothetical protein
MTTLNMDKEYRAELRELKKNRRKVERDLATEERACMKAIKAAAATQRRTVRNAERNYDRAEKRCRKIIAKFQERQGILEGRLS